MARTLECGWVITKRIWITEIWQEAEQAGRTQSDLVHVLTVGSFPHWLSVGGTGKGGESMGCRPLGASLRAGTMSYPDLRPQHFAWLVLVSV